MPWHRRREKFNDLDLELWNARNKVQEMQSKADDARRKPETSSMTVAEVIASADRYDAGVLNADREARDAREKHAAKCREFRTWCAQQRESIPRELDDPARVFDEADRAEGQAFHKEIGERLLTLEAECPTSDDPSPQPKAIRTIR